MTRTLDPCVLACRGTVALLSARHDDIRRKRCLCFFFVCVCFFVCFFVLCALYIPKAVMYKCTYICMHIDMHYTCTYTPCRYLPTLTQVPRIAALAPWPSQTLGSGFKNGNSCVGIHGISVRRRKRGMLILRHTGVPIRGPIGYLQHG